MSEEEAKNRWMAAILDFDWSHDRDNQEDNNNNSEDKGTVA